MKFQQIVLPESAMHLEMCRSQTEHAVLDEALSAPLLDAQLPQVEVFHMHELRLVPICSQAGKDGTSAAYCSLDAI